MNFSSTVYILLLLLLLSLLFKHKRLDNINLELSVKEII